MPHLLGRIAYQIGGREGYETLRENDVARISPGKEKLRAFLETHQPFILLFDEILKYINRAQDVRTRTEVSLATQTFSFFQELTEAVATLPYGMLVVTLPSSYLEDFGERKEESLARLNKIFGRVESIETPVQGEEIYAVIRRRLFEVERLKTGEMRQVIHEYFQTYQQHRDELPAKARDLDYRRKMELAYPFHPDVIDILYEKWSTFSSFQRTRGVLRLLASVAEDLYRRETNIDLIMPGDLNLDCTAIRQEFLRHTGSEYEGIIGSDIAGHEAKAQALDAANKPWKHLAQRVATAVFFHSFSADSVGVALDGVTFAPEEVLLSRVRCEALLARWSAEDQASGEVPAQSIAEPGIHPVSEGKAPVSGAAEGKTPGEGSVGGIVPAATQYHRLRLVVADIPAHKIADVNRGIFMPLSNLVDGTLTFTLEIDATSAAGIPQATLERQIKETIRQIGARVVVEETKSPGG